MKNHAAVALALAYIAIDGMKVCKETPARRQPPPKKGRGHKKHYRIRVK